MATRQLDLIEPEEVISDIFLSQIEEGKRRIEEIGEEMRNLREEASNIRERNVHLCDHPLSELFELPYKHNDYLDSEPPWIICRKCGLTERGWGVGHVALVHGAYEKLPKINYDTWNKWATIRVYEKDKNKWRKK